MQHPAGDDQTTDPTSGPDPETGSSDSEDEDLAALEADLDAVDAALEAIDRGDLDSAESIAASLGSVDGGSPEPDDDPTQVTAPRDSD